MVIYLSILLLGVRAETSDYSEIVTRTEAPVDKPTTGTPPPEIHSEPLLNIEDTPYLVSLTRGGVKYCSAVCIDVQWLLTAAHCIRPKLGQTTRAYFGTTISNVGETRRTIARAIKHPVLPLPSGSTRSNASVTTLNNIALIKLNKPIAYSQTIGKVMFDNTNGPLENLHGRCLGYGKLCRDDDDDSKGARYVPFEIVKADALVLYRDTDLVHKRSACKCDSGGPFVLDNKLLAITVCGESCLVPRLLTNTFLRVSHFEKWINRTLTSHGRKYASTFWLILKVLYFYTIL